MTAQDNDHLAAGLEAPELNIDQERAALLFMLEDLDRTGHQLTQAHHEWLTALDALKDPVFMHDRDYRIMRSNRAYAEHAGMSVKEVIGKPYYEVFPKGDGPLPHCRKSMQEAAEQEEEEIQIAGGEVFQSRSFVVKDDNGDYLYSLHVMEDITERKQAEEALHASEEKYRSLVNNIPDVVWTTDKDGNTTFISQNVGKIYGYTPEEILADSSLWFGNIHPEDSKNVEGAFAELFAGKRLFDVEYRIRRKDGEWIWLHDRAFTVYEKEGEWYADGVFSDITGRKQAEQAVQRANRALRTLSECNHELVHASEEAQLLQAMCRVVVETGGYSAAWVGYKEDDAEKSVRPMAHSGFEPGFADTLRITWVDSERGRGPTGKAVRSGVTQIVQDVANDPDCAPWRETALQHGYASAIALPLRSNGEVFGSFSIYTAEKNAFDRSEIALLEEMAGDLAFGIRMLRLRQEQRRHAEQIRTGLEGTVQAVAAMVEMRDPYTAGHQRRVADLAAAIAIEMGLSEEQVHGIHLAGTIHDLGKIQTPAEILSKPGRLNDKEFGLIKDHPQNGHEILKDIEFPWPIAQMVLQHHERLDGSGYPNGLKGNEILIEARILAVADTVEAMSSHRPYRPGLGIEAALAEVEKGRDIHYDAEVADACLRLFREKGYRL